MMPDGNDKTTFFFGSATPVADDDKQFYYHSVRYSNKRFVI